MDLDLEIEIMFGVENQGLGLGEWDCRLGLEIWIGYGENGWGLGNEIGD